MLKKAFFCSFVCLIILFLFGCNVINKEAIPNSTQANQSTDADSGRPEMSGFSKENKPEETNDLTTILPKPDFGSFSIRKNITNIAAEMEEVSEDQALEYINLCKDCGFTIEKDDSGTAYSAFNADGYKIKILYFDSLHKLDVTLYDSIKLGVFRWPRSDLSNSIPKIETKLGKIDYDTSDYLSIYLGNVTKDDYQDYVENCLDAGFNIDYERANDWYYGYNENGAEIDVRYEGFNIIHIIVLKDGR